jgi:integrase
MPKKLSLYKSVKTERGWRYCKAAFHSNAKVKPNIVLVDRVEEKHAEGSYFTLSDNQWVALGNYALDAQRKLMGMNAQREFQRLSQTPQLRETSVPAANNGRKLIREEIERYLEGLVAAKRPTKSVRMNRNFLNAFADLAKKPYSDQYGRDDMIAFRNDLLSREYKHKYIDTQMDFVLTFFRHHLKRPIVMERGDRLKLAVNPPEPYSDEEIIAMERTATGKHRLLIRLYRSTGCRLQEISHLRSEDVNIHSKTILIHEKPCKDCADCRAQGNKWKPKTAAGTREIPIIDAMVKELQALGNGLLFPDKHGKVQGHMLREIQNAVKESGVPKVKMHRFRDSFAVNKLRDHLDPRSLQRWLGHENVLQTMEYCDWLSSQSDAARRHANNEDTRYQMGVPPAMNKKAESIDSVKSSPATPKMGRAF